MPGHCQRVQVTGFTPLLEVRNGPVRYVSCEVVPPPMPAAKADASIEPVTDITPAAVLHAPKLDTVPPTHLPVIFIVPVDSLEAPCTPLGPEVLVVPVQSPVMLTVPDPLFRHPWQRGAVPKAPLEIHRPVMLRTPLELFHAAGLSLPYCPLGCAVQSPVTLSVPVDPLNTPLQNWPKVPPKQFPIMFSVPPPILLAPCTFNRFSDIEPPAVLTLPMTVHDCPAGRVETKQVVDPAVVPDTTPCPVSDRVILFTP